jgi:glyoxylase-like metal-dependent hydrolase (beta-lactamase superfamily II)
MDMEQIAPHLWHWATPHPEWKPENRGKDGLGWGQIISSYALVAQDTLVLIDPQLPAGEAEAARLWEALDRDVEAHGPPATLITVFWHARSAEEIADHYPGATIWAPADTPDEVAERLSSPKTYSAGDELPGGIRTYGVSRLGDMVLYLPSHKGVAFGDVVLEGVRICPDDWLRDDLTRQDVADALRPLLDEEIELLLLTHGGPVPDNARAKLERALEV